MVRFWTYYNTNVEIFKYKKINTNFSFTFAVSGRGQNS